MICVAFDPGYETNGLFFIRYTDLGGSTALVRYHVSSNPLPADLASAKVVLVIPQPGGEHKSGQLAFGPDSYLYIGVGDGGVGASSVNAHRMDTLLGKFLRIDVERTSSGKAYAFPPHNPFVGEPQARGEIWAYGLRNPWRFSFDRATGDLYIGAVGESTYESIYVQLASSRGGENYGWNVYEGDYCR